TDGIIEAHCHGVVTSTSLMVNERETDRAVKLLSHTPNLDIGIHLNISEDTPVLPPDKVPSLVNTHGSFHGLAETSRRLSCWRVSASEIEAEFRAQIQRIKEY